MTKTSSSSLDERGPVDATGPRPRAARPEWIRTGLFAGALAVTGLVATAAGSVAGALPGTGLDGFTTTAVRLVLLAAGAVVAGLGLVHPLAGARASFPPGPWHRRAAWTAGLLAAVAALAGHLHGDVSRTGTLVWVVAALAVPVLLEARFARPVWTVPVAALPGLALTAVTLGSGHAGTASAADMVFAAASAVLAGVLVTRAVVLADGAVLTGAPGAVPGPQAGVADDATAAEAGPEPDAAPGRPAQLAVAGVVAAGTAVLAAVARILLAGPFSLVDLLGTAYGRAGLAAVLLPVPALVLLARRGAPSTSPARRAWGAASPGGVPRDGVLAGAAGGLAVVGVAAAAVTGLLPAPAPAAVAGQALLRTVPLDGQDVPLLIAPLRPGPNLVQLGGSGYTASGAPAPADDHATARHDMTGMSGHDMSTHGGSATVAADGDPVGFTSRAGARGGWAVLDVPAGTTSLTVSMGGDSATVPVDVGEDTAGASSAALTGRDGPECASAIVGAVLAGGPDAGGVTGCPSQTLDPDQARALTATVRTMAEKGARNVRLVGDASPRSVAAARLVRDEGAKAGLAFSPAAENDPNSALVVVAGWEHAVDVLGETGARSRTTPTHLGGTFLAPWLLTGEVLRQTASAFLPLSFAPNEPDAQRYALALAATHPDTAPSASGYLAWARTAGVPTDPRPSLYGAAAVNVPMSIEPAGSSGHHGGPDPAAWFPGGTVVPVSGPMDPGGSS